MLFDNNNATATIDICYTIGSQRLKEDVLSLELATIKDFLRFHVIISRERIDDKRIMLKYKEHVIVILTI